MKQLFFLFFSLFLLSNVYGQAFSDFEADSLISSFLAACENSQPSDKFHSSLEQLTKKKPNSQRIKWYYEVASLLQELVTIQQSGQQITKEIYAPMANKLSAIEAKAMDQKDHLVVVHIMQARRFLFLIGFEYNKRTEVLENVIQYIENIKEETWARKDYQPYIIQRFYRTIVGELTFAQRYDEVEQYIAPTMAWSDKLYTNSGRPKRFVEHYVIALRNIGDYYQDQGVYDSSKVYYNRGLVEAKYHQNELLEFMLYTDIVDAYTHNYHLDSAVVYLIEAQKIAEKNHYDQYIYAVYSKFCGIYSVMGNVEKEIEYTERLLEECRKGVPIGMGMQAGVYWSIGRYFEIKEELDSAIVYIAKSLETYELRNEVNEICLAHIDLKRLYLKKGDTTQANYHMSKASETALLLTIEGPKEGGIYVELAEYNIEQGNYNAAVEIARKAYRIGKKLDYVKMKYASIKAISLGYIMLNQADSARKYFDKLGSIRLEMVHAKQDSLSMELEEKYETAKKEQAITFLSQRNQLYGGMAILIGVLLIMAIYFFYRQRKITQELQDLQSTKDRLLGVISHDLRTPFNSLMLFSELSKKNIDTIDKSELENYFNVVNQSAQSAYVLFEDLLSWVRDQTGELNYNPVSVELHQAIKQTTQLLSSNIINKQLTVHQSVNNLGVKADAYMFSTIVRNLLSNAIRYSSMGGQIAIEAVREGEQVQLTITDEGEGMDAALVATLFQPDRKSKGNSGLGLAITKKFVELNHGTITVSSVKGKGTVFKVSLPVAPIEGSTSLEPVTTVYQIEVLSVANKEKIAALLPALKALEIYQASKISSLLQPLKEGADANLIQWIQQVENSVYDSDEAYFLQLCEQAK